MKTVRSLLPTHDGPCRSVSPEATVREGLELLADGDASALLVVDAGTLAGVVSERDVARKVTLQGQSPETTLIADIMSSAPAVSPDDSIEACARLMTRTGAPRVVVVDSSGPLGIVSLESVLGAAIAEQNAIIEDALLAGQQKNGYLKSVKEATLDQLLVLNKAHLHPLRTTLGQLYNGSHGALKSSVRKINREVDQMLGVLSHLSSWYYADKAMENKRVLLAEADRKSQITAKMALGGTGADLDIVTDLAEGERRIAEVDYDIVCLSPELLPLAAAAHARNPDVAMVVLTNDDIADCLPLLRKYPFLSNIVSRGQNDRTFTVRSFTTTVSKLINRDIFGIDKYLSWGVELHEQLVSGSATRYGLIETMEDHFRQLGLRRSIITKCATVAEELLLNSIYDAPHDADGKPRYSADRTAQIVLEPSERALFRYACDGVLAAISVEDPFGEIRRDTILDYLESCYGGKPGSLTSSGGKGGAGQGIFMITEIADLAVFNIKNQARSEVVALFAVDLETRKKIRTSGFHFFNV